MTIKRNSLLSIAHQVLLIEITDHGYDFACYLDGEYIISADPGCGESTDTVITLAKNLASALNTTVEHIDWVPKEDWNWDDIIQEFRALSIIQHPLSIAS